jgi:hypothetical protein
MKRTWTPVARKVFAARMKAARLRRKNPKRRSLRKRPQISKRGTRRAWYEVRVNGKLVWTAATLESAKFVAKTYHRAHPGSRITVIKT